MIPALPVILLQWLRHGSKPEEPGCLLPTFAEIMGPTESWVQPTTSHRTPKVVDGLSGSPS